MPYPSSKDKMKGQGGVLDNLISFQLQIFPGKNFTAQSWAMPSLSLSTNKQIYV